MSGPLSYERLEYGTPAIKLTPVGVQMYGEDATGVAVQLADAAAYATLHPLLGALKAAGDALWRCSPDEVTELHANFDVAAMALLNAYGEVSAVDVSSKEPAAVLTRRGQDFERIIRVPSVDEFPIGEPEWVPEWEAVSDGRWVFIGHQEENFMSGEFPSAADATAVAEMFNRSKA